MIRRIFGNLYFLTFLNGFLLASLFYFKMEANYESDLFQAIRYNITSKIDPSESQDSLVVKVMHACNKLLVNREPFFDGKQFDGFNSDYLLAPASFDLMTAKGACGSFSMVLARVLQGYHYPVRIAQMKANGVYAAHNVVEVKTRHGWAVLDPYFDVYFVNPEHNLASFEEVKNNWEYYVSQLPVGYDMKYRYEDVRYSNWTKIPIILPSVKKILDLAIGKKEADSISLRTHFLRKYNIVFSVLLVFFVLVFSFTLVQLIRAKVFPEKNIPVTFSNVFKYLRLHRNEKRLSEQRQV
jgi:hypothetical protein